MNEYIENWNEFNEWFAKLQKIGAELFGYTDLSKVAWLDYFKDGYTPHEALTADLSNGWRNYK